MAREPKSNSNQLRDTWARYARGWWSYFQLADVRKPVFRLEQWIRRHIRKCFWLRWHSTAGREHALRRLGLRGSLLAVARSSRGAWHIARTGSLHKALGNALLRHHGFLLPSDLAAQSRCWVQPPDAENRTSGGVGG